MYEYVWPLFNCIVAHSCRVDWLNLWFNRVCGIKPSLHLIGISLQLDGTHTFLVLKFVQTVLNIIYTFCPGSTTLIYIGIWPASHHQLAIIQQKSTPLTQPKNWYSNYIDFHEFECSGPESRSDVMHNEAWNIIPVRWKTYKWSKVIQTQQHKHSLSITFEFVMWTAI